MISNKQHPNHTQQPLVDQRGLRVESLENRNLLAADLDDSLAEAPSMGLVSEQPISRAAEISEPTDVDIVRVSLADGQSIDIDVDTPANGPGGLGGYLRVFNEQGIEVASNNDAMGPNDAALGFDPYVRFTAQQNGNYYIAVSNWENIRFDPLSGGGDVGGTQHSVGAYALTVRALPQFDTDDAMNEAINLGSAGPTPYSVNGSIDNDVDVDLYRIELRNNQAVGFDIDTVENGPGGLGSYLTLFDANGNVVGSNNDGVAPGEAIGFDAYLEASVVNGGIYYVAVSNYGNTGFNPVTGSGDTGGSMYATGDYRLTVGELTSRLMASTAWSLPGTGDVYPDVEPYPNPGTPIGSPDVGEYPTQGMPIGQPGPWYMADGSANAMSPQASAAWSLPGTGDVYPDVEPYPNPGTPNGSPDVEEYPTQGMPIGQPGPWYMANGSADAMSPLMASAAWSLPGTGDVYPDVEPYPNPGTPIGSPDVGEYPTQGMPIGQPGPWYTANGSLNASTALSNAGVGFGASGSLINGSSMVTELNADAQVPPIGSALDPNAMPWNGLPDMVAAGTTALNVGFGQSQSMSSLDSQNAVATDLALLQSIW